MPHLPTQRYIEYPSPPPGGYECASKAQWFAQVLFQDTNDDRRDLTLFEDAIHQTAKLTSDTDEVKVLLKKT